MSTMSLLKFLPSVNSLCYIIVFNVGDIVYCSFQFDHLHHIIGFIVVIAGGLNVSLVVNVWYVTLYLVILLSAYSTMLLVAPRGILSTSHWRQCQGHHAMDSCSYWTHCALWLQ